MKITNLEFDVRLVGDDERVLWIGTASRLLANNDNDPEVGAALAGLRQRPDGVAYVGGGVAPLFSIERVTL